MSCKIDRGATFDCAALNQAGIGDYIYLINKEDYDNRQLQTIDAFNQINALVIAVGTQGYRFEAAKGSLNIIPSSPLKSATSLDGFTHQLDIRTLDVSQLSRENIAKMRFNKVVAIVPLANGKFMLYGANVGMRISDYQENPGDTDMGGTVQFILKTPDFDPAEIYAPILISDVYNITLLDSIAPTI